MICPLPLQPSPGDQVLERKGPKDQKPGPCGQPALDTALFYH